MPGRSSADPDDLDGWVGSSRGLNNALPPHHVRLASLQQQFSSSTRWGGFDASSLINGFGTYIGYNETDAQWVATIAGMFRRADAGAGVSSLPDSVIAAGLRAAGLAGTRQSVTFDAAIAWGMPPTSGFANDPVNTANGNFVEVEADLDLGGLLSALSFRRTYNSRSDRDGPFGPGWASWATARLRAAPDGAHWEGPDGQRAVVPRAVDGVGFRRLVGLSGLVVPADAGLALEWFGGRRWEFDAEGLPLAVEHGPGTRVRFEHVEGRLVGLVHDGGPRLDVHWSGARIVSLECSDGRRVDYRYDDAGHLVEASGPGGARRYEVDEQGRVLAVADADGVVEVRNTYDADGRVLEQVSPHGRRTRMRYLPGRVTIVDDADGSGPVNTYLHDRFGRLTGVVDGHRAELVKEYDVWGNPTTVTDRLGAVTLQEWDDRDRLVRRVLPGGAVFDIGYDDTDRVVEVALSTVSAGGARTAVSRYRYAGAERIPSEIVDPEGGVTRLEVADGRVLRLVDPDGVELGFGHDRAGHITSVTDAHGHTALLERDAAGRVTATVTPLGLRTELDLDAAGRPVERRDPDGAVWRFGHTPAGRLASVTDPTGARSEVGYGENGEAERVVDPLGHVTDRRFDALGNLVGVVDPDGAKWELTYDALCRLVGVHDPAGGTWLREHDADGNLTATIDPTGARRTAAVDRSGRVTRVDDGVTWEAYEYDELGRVVVWRRPDGAETRATYDRCGRRTAVTDPLGGVTRCSWTAAGRLASVTSPLGNTFHVEYDRVGQRSAEVDPRGRRRTYRYDADGRVTRVTRAGEAWSLEYDAAGRVVARRHPDGGTTRYGYDPAGRVTSVTDPTGGVVRYGYDPRGDLVEAVDALGGVTRYARDVHGRVTRVTHPLGGVVERDYDELGRLTSEIDPLGRRTRWEHDPAGRLSRRVNAAGEQVSWSYDVSGRLAGYRSGDGEPVALRRDAVGRVAEVDEPGRAHRLTWDRLDRLVAKVSGEAELRWEYDADGNRVGVRGPDGSRTGYGYDAAGALESAEHPLLGTVVLRRDAAGRVTELDAPGRRTAWAYRDGRLVGHRVERDDRVEVTALERDAAGRVVTETRDGVARRYGYDAAGQLTSAGDQRFGYDAAGRLTTESGPAGTVQYAYDAAGQLLTCSRHGAVTEYRFDAAGRRVAETGPDGERTFTWNAWDELIGIHRRGESSTELVVDAFGDLAAVDGVPLVWDPSGPIPRLCAIGQVAVLGCDEQQWAVAGSDGVHWLDADWQGSVDGEHDPWGLAGAGDGVGPGWRGELAFDGLTWLRRRAYDPATRGFLSPDPWPPVPGTPVSDNPYHYANNDPVNLVDPLGLRPMTDADLEAYRQANQGLSLSDLGHGVLDVAGMVPVIGEAADLVNAGWYLAEGDYTNAALAAAAMIPIAGGAVVAGKYAKRSIDLAQSLEKFEPLRRTDFVADARGTVIPTSASRMREGFEAHPGITSTSLGDKGTSYTLPDGSRARIMEPSGQAPLRASFENANGQPVDPFTGKPPQPPKGMTKAERVEYVRDRTHVELGP